MIDVGYSQETRMSHLLHLLFSIYTSVLAILFLIGASGSTIVLLLSFWEDAKVLTGHEE